MPSELAVEVSQVPERFETSNRSTACLLEDAGFPELRDLVTVEDIQRALQKNPALVEKWFERSKDQRLAGGWGIEEVNGAYRIQSYSNEDHLIVEDRVLACAEVIVRYTLFIGEVQAHSPKPGGISAERTTQATVSSPLYDLATPTL